MLIRFNPKVEHLKCVVLTPKEGLKLEKTMVKLLPGVNEVTNDEWKAMRGNIVNEINSGEITILAQRVSAGRGKEGGIKAKDLKQMPVNIAVKYVSECNSPDTLEKWYAEITNEEVRLAITKRFNKLEIELPEDKIPETPNESPMSIEEFEEDEEQEDDNATDNLEDDDDTDNDSDDVIDFSKMSVAELKEECERRGIDSEGMKKKEMIEALNNSSNKE